MGHVAVAGELVGIDELFKLDASETEPENGDDGNDEDVEPGEMPHPTKPGEMPHP